MPTVSREFVTAGKAIFTLKVPTSFQEQYSTKPHYTFKVQFKEGQGKFRDTYFVSLLTGPENTSNYTYLGILDKDSAHFRVTAKSAFSAESMVVKLLERTLVRIWGNSVNVLEEAGFSLHHEGRCGRCGRLLTVPESIESGIGPECADIMGRSLRSLESGVTHD